jgi:hypothetical protein
MAEKPDNTNLYLAIGVGGLAFYLWQQQKAAEQDAARNALEAAQLGAGLPGAGPQQLTTQPIDPVLGATRAALDAVLPGAGALAPLAAELGQNVLDEGEAMLDGIIHGGLDWETAGRVAELITAPFSVPLVASYNLVADLFGWSGKPLDAVNDVLLAQINDPLWNGRDNVPPAAGIYAMDAQGVLHYIRLRPGCSSNDVINCADFSWREVIAVPPPVFAQFQIGVDITSKSQIQPMSRPVDPTEIRRAFGPKARFKTGTVDLHGPWEVPGLYFHPTLGWLTQEEGTALSASSLWRQRGIF